MLTQFIYVPSLNIEDTMIHQFLLQDCRYIDEKATILKIYIQKVVTFGILFPPREG